MMKIVGGMKVAASRLARGMVSSANPGIYSKTYSEGSDPFDLEEALEIALTDAGIPFESQKEICPEFHGRRMEHSYRPDLICYGKIVVELKAAKGLLPQHFGQLRNYLGLLCMQVGLLVNFHGYPNVDIRRVYLNDMNEQGNVEDVATGQISKIMLHDAHGK